MRTCLKNDRKNAKNAKMNSSTQIYFTLKNVWKIIFEKLMQKLTHFLDFTLKVPNKMMFSIKIVWKWYTYFKNL